MCVCPRSFSCCCGRALPTRFLPRERSCCASETTPQPRTVQRVLLWSYRLMPPTPTPPQRLNQLNNDIHPPKMRNYCFASLTRTMPTFTSVPQRLFSCSWRTRFLAGILQTQRKQSWQRNTAVQPGATTTAGRQKERREVSFTSSRKA